MKLKVKGDDNVYKRSVVLLFAQEKRKSSNLKDGS